MKPELPVVGNPPPAFMPVLPPVILVIVTASVMLSVPDVSAGPVMVHETEPSAPLMATADSDSMTFPVCAPVSSAVYVRERSIRTYKPAAGTAPEVALVPFVI